MKSRLAKGALLMALTIATGAKAEIMQLTAPLIGQVPAITEERFDWNHQSTRSEVPPVLRARGCVGEYVPVSFLAMCAGKMRDFYATVTDLKGPGQIPASAWNLRWVKWQWWSGELYYDNRKTTWAPGMLLHDFDLIEAHHDRPGVNVYPDKPRDAEALLPSDIPDSGIGWTRQLYLLVKIPQVPPGLYEGEVVLTSKDTAELRVPLRLYVWPFELAEPGLDYSMCYRSQLLRDDAGPVFGGEGRTPDQMREDLRNMARHGFTNPNIYEGCGMNIPRVLGLRRSAGISNKRVFLLGGYVGMDAQKRWYRQWGVEEVATYSAHEDKPEDYEAMWPKWAASAKSGGRNWGFFNFTGFEKYLTPDMHIVVTGWLPGQDTGALVKQLHAEGKEVYFYGHPQTGNLAPVQYRRNWGVRTWAFGADGIMPYAWQHVFGHMGPPAHPWDDFAVRERKCGKCEELTRTLSDDCPACGEKLPAKTIWRSHMLTYPVVEGPVVDTLSWEGAAGAVVDVRYTRSLEQAIEGKRTRAAQEARAYLNYLREEAGTVDLDAMRLRLAQLTVAAQ